MGAAFQVLNARCGVRSLAVGNKICAGCEEMGAGRLALLGAGSCRGEVTALGVA